MFEKVHQSHFLVLKRSYDLMFYLLIIIIIIFASIANKKCFLTHRTDTYVTYDSVPIRYIPHSIVCQWWLKGWLNYTGKHLKSTCSINDENISHTALKTSGMNTGDSGKHLMSRDRLDNRDCDICL